MTHRKKEILSSGNKLQVVTVQREYGKSPGSGSYDTNLMLFKLDHNNT